MKHNKRMSEYRRQSKQAGFQRIELRLSNATVAQIDKACQCEAMTRAAYLSAVVDADSEAYPVA